MIVVLVWFVVAGCGVLVVLFLVRAMLPGTLNEAGAG